MLFRGQPEVEEETGDIDATGKLKVRRRKADDEHLIRRALLESRLIDTVISLPLNVFYGAGVPACLLILRKQRPVERRDRVLLIYAARHYRELSAQNELRPQDVMRMLVHYHSYGDASKAPGLVEEYSERIHCEIDRREADEVGRLEAEYQPQADRLAALDNAVQEAREKQRAAVTKRDKAKAASALTKLRKQRDKIAARVGTEYITKLLPDEVLVRLEPAACTLNDPEHCRTMTRGGLHTVGLGRDRVLGQVAHGSMRPLSCAL